MSARDKAAWKKRLPATMQAVQHTRELLHLGHVIIDEAKQWESYYGIDPDWRQHQLQLLKAIQ